MEHKIAVTVMAEDKKILKRHRIIEAAFHLFSTKNYHEVMIEDVAKLALVGKGTVYNHFSSKEELYFSIMRLRMEKLLTSLKNNISVETNSINSLHTYIMHLYMFMMKYRSFFLIYRKETLKAENEICTEILFMESELRKLLMNIVEKGTEEKYFRQFDEGYSADLIIGSIFGAVTRGISKELTVEQVECERERLFDFVLQALLTEKGNELLPLKGKTIVITRSVEQSKESSDQFRKLGANVIVFPTLNIIPPDNWQEFDNIIMADYPPDYLILTSAHTAGMVKLRLEQLNRKIDFNSVKVVAIGNKTASACEKNGIPVDIIPSKFSSEGVIEELYKIGLEGKKVFIPRSALGREELPSGLEKLGAVILTAPVYKIAVPSKEDLKEHILKLNSSEVDLFVFTSPSTFDNFLKIMEIREPEKYFERFKVAAIGPTTKTSIENSGVKVSVMPEEYNIEGLTRAVINFYKNNKEERSTM